VTPPVADGSEQQRKLEELTAIVRGIRDRVRAQYPESGATDLWNVPVPDLLPLVHARDAAAGKAASIGSVNPRPGGPANKLIQFIKKIIARSLRWFVRDQIEFNRHVITCVEAALEALNEHNRALIAASRNVQEAHNRLRADLEESKAVVEALQTRLAGRDQHFTDLSAHWHEWRKDWERKVSTNETQFLRSVADLQSAFQHRATLMESNFRDIVKSQHVDYLGALERSTDEAQKRFWGEIEKAQREYERMIHEELRMFRQRAAIQPAAQRTADPVLDYGWFAEKFRGPESYVRSNVARYVDHFRGRDRVLDIGCGRGEFLEAMREAGVPARGIDLSDESVVQCRAKGLDVELADLFPYLESLPGGSLDGIFCSQVVEHLTPDSLPRFIRLAGEKTTRGGVIVIETPNPACLAIFATHFYLDPTHQRPVPAPLLTFYLQESGFGRIRVEFLSPAIDSMPSLAELPDNFRGDFFGGLDYAAIGWRL
jgi:O-antigen chain-terminating methyltransferase